MTNPAGIVAVAYESSTNPKISMIRTEKSLWLVRNVSSPVQYWNFETSQWVLAYRIEAPLPACYQRSFEEARQVVAAD